MCGAVNSATESPSPVRTGATAEFSHSHRGICPTPVAQAASADTIGSAAVSQPDVRRYLFMQGYDYVSYETFGRRFFEVAVTDERVGAAFAAFAGNQFDMEPIAQGPGGIAKVSAKVTIKEPHVSRNVGDDI